MQGARITRVIMRSKNIWLKVFYNVENSIFTSSTLWKEEANRENSGEPEDEIVAKRKAETQLKWNSTNLALFGPIIKDKKRKKTQETISEETPKPEKKYAFKNSLIPVSLWNTNRVTLKLDKNVKYKKNIKMNKEISATVAATSPQKTKEPKQEDIAEVLQTDCGESSAITRDTLKSEVVETCDNLSTPFFTQDNIILPFPMILNKHYPHPSQTKIYSIESAKVDFPSVTQVLNKTMSDKSEMMLALWRKRKIAELGEDGLREYMRESKLTGKELHTSIETYLRGVEYSSVRVDPRISGHWLSMKSILHSLDDVVVLESYVVHPHLKYKGFVDCVARHENNLVVIEWKTSQRTKATLKDAYDDPVQIAAYVGALNADETYPFEIENALLVVAYPTGKPADVLILDREKCEYYWNQWLTRLEAFQKLKNNQTKI